MRMLPFVTAPMPPESPSMFGTVLVKRTLTRLSMALFLKSACLVLGSLVSCKNQYSSFPRASIISSSCSDADETLMHERRMMGDGV